jgi:ribulose-5-phosphate 4-epimerase/fuculose-1-phosphate aldolase
MTDERGSVKYKCSWKKAPPVENSLITELTIYRTKLYKLGYIGIYPNGIGFGNMSIRLRGNTFLITGTATGGFETLTNEHFTKVMAYDFKQNWLECQGPIQASSESLTHAAVYESSPNTFAIIHIHNKLLWDRLKHNVPTSASTIEYGTPEMAIEIKRLFKDTNLSKSQILVMAGHEEGIITFGRTINEAFDLIITHY